ncbi:sigma-70 family RNA polymerase sigma factor [Sulfuriroseicoccus oceanibius]|uniref:Sigma-70 family RNA polymerase sigma factor n=1 Tax=Sulfuriroseicoccus oceanibius TaxID=2707525 RepID=A0A6B3L315_9BACT|nr:sigma-70 family RNA polymerase sigma factor [Sulfuriroseicoccus oceanibius]QQL44222.1 sigma-70 family RNA polymerase sigma factor [Sulfuriroseicoccus oceanibius]
MAGSPQEQSPEQADDLELVARSQQGDTRAYDELVRRHSRRIYGLLYNMTSNHEDTNDLMQDVFSRAYRMIDRFEGKSAFSTWLHSVAVNLALNFLKKRKRRAAMSLDDVDNGIVNDPAFVDDHHVSDPVRQAKIKEIQKRLNDALQTLSHDHRAVVTMFDIQGMPHTEISQILGVSEGTVRSRLFYAHRQLQTQLGDLL